MERVRGVGGVFFKARDPEMLAAWYRDHLGVPVAAGQTYAAFESAGPGDQTVWSTFPAQTEYFGPGNSGLMVNYRVDDLDAMLAQLRSGSKSMTMDASGGPWIRKGTGSSCGSRNHPADADHGAATVGEASEWAEPDGSEPGKVS